MQIGTTVLIGNKHSSKCSYESVVNKKGIVIGVYTKNEPYRLKGTHLFCRVDVGQGYEWEIHIDDCLLTFNKMNKGVLTRLDE